MWELTTPTSIQLVAVCLDREVEIISQNTLTTSDILFSIMKTMLSRLLFLTAISMCGHYAAFFQDTRQLTQEKPKVSDKRIALVIGNGAYTKAKELPNPANDASDMAKVLKEVGFEVLSGTDLTKRQMEGLIRDFGAKLASGGTGLFYYAGHGLQVGGENYLVPVDAEIPQEDEVAYAAVPLGLVLTKMATAKNDLNIVILDACRNNPFARSWRGYRDIGNNDGLAKISPPTGTLVLYATEPGRVASDGAGRNGLFTESLLNQIKKPNIEYDQLVKSLSADVWQKSNKQQLPWKEGNSLSDFYFVKAASNVISKPEKAETSKISAGTIRKNSLGMELVYVPQGEFTMGSINDPNEKPAHKVTFSQGFWMGKYEVTQSQYESVIGTNPSNFKGCAKCPVEQVSWDDAKAFIARLNAKNDGFVYSLPTEAQWEYAARAGTTGFWASPMVDDMAWYSDNASAKTHPVGTKRPNAFGLFDMHGNVWEWCEDYFTPYSDSPVTDPKPAPYGYNSHRVLRGGSWYVIAPNVRSSIRDGGKPAEGTDTFGFRVAAVLAEGKVEAIVPPAPPNIAPTEKLPSADDVLNAFARAIGSEQAKKITTLVMVGVMENEINGQKINTDIEMYSKQPDKYLRLIKFPSGEITGEVYNGNRGWRASTGKPIEEVSAAEVEANRRSRALGTGDIAVLKTLYPVISVTGKQKLGDKDVFALELKTRDGKTERMYFNIATKLLDRWHFTDNDASQPGVVYSVDSDFDDYQSVNGYRIPMTIRQKTPGITITIKFNVFQTKFNVPLDDNLFKGN